MTNRRDFRQGRRRVAWIVVGAGLLTGAVSLGMMGSGAGPTDPLANPAAGAAMTSMGSAGGAGGTAKDGVIEVQGDHVERVMAWLTQAGHRVKRTGG